jgi:hypothetical protein
MEKGGNMDVYWDKWLIIQYLYYFDDLWKNNIQFF